MAMLLYGTKYPRSKVQDMATQFVNSNEKHKKIEVLMYLCTMTGLEPKEALESIEAIAAGEGQRRVA